VLTKSEERKRDKYYADELIMPPECDLLCRFRPCYNKYENIGVYSQGRGYLSYHSEFKPACGTRMMRGCEVPMPPYDMAKSLDFVIDNINAKKIAYRKAALAILKAMRKEIEDETVDTK